MNDIKLETKLVGNIKGLFRIPSYQRGYRWGVNEVKFLLDDIASSNGKPYCLQPVVVRKINEEEYELVDGQQRLTTIFLIYKYMYMNKESGGFMPDSKFSIKYDTRDKSEEFLNNVDFERSDENIDFHHIANSYKIISDYFEKKGDKKQSAMSQMNKSFDNTVSIIWYEIPKTESAIDLFTRLNIGKIPLTSSELVKALFLRSNNDTQAAVKNRQEEISLQWDNMERDLHDSSLWAFLTNCSPEKYPTRIDLVLDLMSRKQPGEKEDYFTFFYFDNKVKAGEDLYNIWVSIQLTFLLLKGWHENHECYHRIGYLIASGHKTLGDIYDASQEVVKGIDVKRTKSEFQEYLCNEIKESIKLEDDLNFADLSYESDTNREMIERLLLLFNVESVRTVDSGRQWFPFDQHKQGYWSLEHIHAQNSEGLNTKEKQERWLADHIPSLKGLKSEQANLLVAKMETLLQEYISNPNTKKTNAFVELQKEATELLSEHGGIGYIHKVSNMALLDCGDNAALSNYFFGAKRDIVVGWDKMGKYIPFCTKMVFFKYYTPSEENQLMFWGIKDRNAYISAINDKLKDLLTHQIRLEEN